ncbi:MAG: DUF1761 domain-containing protein [Bacteroidetes bacterium]|nr:MAG: DUF1761 domain-containing protein [Bacteroidota bacterium]
MENFNLLAVAVAALIPMAVGFFWYGKMGFERPWMAAADMTEEKIQSANMGLIFGVSFVMAFILSFVLQFSVIHQFSLYSLVADDPAVISGAMDSENAKWFLNAMEMFGGKFRTFGHGAVHGGIMVGLLTITPILTIVALFERRSFKYIAINAGYWIVTLAIMGGILCAWQ